MRIKSVTFGFTKNMGSFQSARADCTVKCSEEGLDFRRAMLLAEAVVYEELEMKLQPAHDLVLRNYHG